jgi:uncharacterized protein (TIGR00251 family)
MAIELNSSGPETFLICLKVVPGASRERIVGELGEALKVAVTAPPEDGAANAAVEKLLARELGLSRKQVALVGGLGSRQKTLRITGLTREELSQRIAKLTDK